VWRIRGDLAPCQLKHDAAETEPMNDPGLAPLPVQREESDSTAFTAMLGAGFAVAFAIIAIGLSLRGHGGQQSGATSAAKANVSTINISLSDFKIIPDRSSVPAGPVKLQLRNIGDSSHSIAIDGIGASAKIRPGKSGVLDLGTLEAGTYTWYCPVAGHRDVGMVGTLTVTPANGGATKGGSLAALPALANGTSSDATDGKVDIDAAHAQVVKAFLAGPPAKTEGHGGLPLAAQMENGIPVFNLTAKVVQWEVAPGKKYEAWTYNGTVPGPEIRVKQGQTVKIRVKNQLPESTSIHFHGVEISDNKQDGVTFVTQDPIKPGATYEYTLTPINCGSHMYHSHHAADAQVPLGLLGAFIVDCTTTPVPSFAAHDTETTQILTDGPLGFGMNGKGFPATFPIVAKVGEKTLVRFMNEGLIIHPMHLHGHRMLVVGKDGNYLPAPYEADTLNIAPGERYDVIVTSLYPGAWAFHCHILTHAESDQGLHGMTTVWLVQPK
jgi:manganese oxidase